MLKRLSLKKMSKCKLQKPIKVKKHISKVCMCVTSSRWRGHEVAGEDQQFFRFVGPLLVRTTLPPHPLGTLELAVGSGRSTLTASSGYGGRSAWRALTTCFTAMAPSCHSPQGFRHGPGQPTLRQFLGLQNRTQATAWVLPNALVRARCTQEEGVCVCIVCLCVCHS